jgi:vacuolar-type H+-ATPase subunit H
VNDKRIQDVIEIENQADEIYQKAVAESQRIPQEAEQEAKKLLSDAKAAAELQVQDLIKKAEAKQESDDILAKAEEAIHHNDALAKRNFDRAVSYVIARILGREA